MSRIGSALLAIAIAACPVSAQPIHRIEQIPALDRNAADFYGAIVGAGPRVKIEWKLAPLTVERTGHVVLTLAISNAANPDELQRPPLADMPQFRTLFDSIENLPDQLQGKVVEFRYRLRARNEGEFDLPLPKYRYYVPQLPEGRRFQLATVPGLKLTVTKPVEAKTQPVPIVAPEEFFQLPMWWWDEPVKTTPTSGWFNPWWVAAMTLPVFACIVGIVWFRYFNPDAVKRAELLRRKEVRKTLERLDEAKSADAVEEAIDGYLRVRWQIPTSVLSTSEIIAAFEAIQGNGNHIAQLRQLFERCEALRFGGGIDPVPNVDAQAWVLAVEAEHA